MTSSSMLKFENIRDFMIYSKKIAANNLYMKYLHSPATLNLILDEVSKILLNDPDPFYRKAIEEELVELHDLEANRNFSALDAAQMLVEASLKAEAIKASEKLVRSVRKNEKEKENRK